MADQVSSNIISAESRRRLSPMSYEDSKLKVSELPRDTVIKRIDIVARGSFTVTFASGSPVFSEFGPASRILPRLDVIVDGQRTVKSIDWHMQRCLNHLYYGNSPRRAYTSNPGATLRAGTEWIHGTVNYPSTTQKFLINEAISLHFEMPWAYSMGREATMLNLKNVSSAELRYNFGAISNVQRDETSPVSVTYSTIDLNFVATLIEARDVPANAQFYDFKETVKRVTFSAEARDSLIDLPRGNGLAGIGLLARNGNANKSLHDRVIRDLQLQINGQQVIQRTDFSELQESNQMRFGAASELSGGDHALKGFAFMNLLKNGDIRSAINTSIGAGVDQIQLAVNTAPSSGDDAATYTNPVELTVHTQEIAAVPTRV